MGIQAPRTSPLSAALLNAFAGANTRKLSPEERSTVEQYLDTLNQSRLSPGPTGASTAPYRSTLTPKRHRSVRDALHYPLWHHNRRSQQMALLSRLC
ncbi:hypothetical protein ACVXG7_28550 [Enterobacter hormaechei]